MNVLTELEVKSLNTPGRHSVGDSLYLNVSESNRKSWLCRYRVEGEADANQDNKITAGELHSYVHANVIQQSSGSQTPELQGDADRVLVKFQ